MRTRLLPLGSRVRFRESSSGITEQWNPAPFLLRNLQSLAPAASAEVWSWGSGKSGQLGHGDEKDERSPRRVSEFCVPLNVEASNGRCEPDSNDLTNIPNGNIPKDKGGEIQLPGDGYGVACGLFHSACWAGGHLWLWGKGDAGRLGQGDELSRYSPTLNQYLPPVRCAALGGLHSVALAEDGVYSWGFGGFGALGHGRGQFGRELEPREVDGPWLQDEDPVVHVAAGGAHTAAVTLSGAAYSWGRDEGEGRLGHKESDRLGTNEVPYPVLVPDLPPVHTVACGGFFSVALTKDGRVWSWGGNMNGELGRKYGRKAGLIEKLSTTRVVAVAAGGYHVAALDEDGSVWTWGRGGSGQLGHESLQTELAPRRIEALGPHSSAGPICAIICGSTWTAAVSEGGDVYTWGKNSDCQLGLPQATNSIVATPSRVEMSVSQKHGDGEGSEKRRVVGVAGGASHGVALVIG